MSLFEPYKETVKICLTGLVDILKTREGLLGMDVSKRGFKLWDINIRTSLINSIFVNERT